MDATIIREDMQTTVHPPSQSVSEYIHRFVYGKSKDGPCKLAIPPTGGIFIITVLGAPLHVHCRDRSYAEEPTYFFGGQLRRERPVLESRGEFELLGMELKPTGFHRLFHSDASMLTDSITDFTGKFPEHAAWLDEQLCGAPEVDNVIAAFTQLVGQLAESSIATPDVNAVIDDIAARHGAVRVNELAGRHEFTTRSLHKRFTQTVGVPPKHYAKIVQINAIARSLLNDDSDKLHEIAVEHGFFDQAHFIRDFQRLAGMTPSSFLERGSQFLKTFLGGIPD